jgi:hypothetical protein
MILIAASALHGYYMLTRIEMSYFPNRNSTATTRRLSQFELALFCLYSPAHALLWMLTTSTNLVPVFLIMAILSKQVGFIQDRLKKHHLCSYYFNTFLVACVRESILYSYE